MVMSTPCCIDFRMVEVEDCPIQASGQGAMDISTELLDTAGIQTLAPFLESAPRVLPFRWSGISEPLPATPRDPSRLSLKVTTERFTERLTWAEILDRV